MRAAYEIRKPAFSIMFAYPEHFGWADRVRVSCSGLCGFSSCPHREQSCRFTAFFADTSIHLPFHSIYSSMIYAVRRLRIECIGNGRDPD
jgi:hypothetical protein